MILANSLPASRLFLIYHEDDEGMKLTTSNLKCDYEVLKCDVSSETQVKAIFDKIEQIDVLINNAGVTADALIKNMSEEQWDRVFDVNLKGAFLCSKHAIPKIGKECHHKRIKFERNIPQELRRKLYESLAQLGLGRQCTIYARPKI